MYSRSRYLSVFAMCCLVLAAMLLVACQPAEPAAEGGEETGGDTGAGDTGGEATEEPAAGGGDLLATIQERGVLLISTDPAYPPQSALVEDAERPSDTKCTGDQLTAAELEGFDVDSAVEIAERLGVEPCFVTPQWDIIIAGNWADRWDISVGSMTITPERMTNLYFSQPYYTTPAAFFVHTDNTSFTAPADLSGETVGLCAGCTYEYYMDGSLSIPGETIDFIVPDAEVVTYDTDTTALEDLALGDGVRLDAVLTAQPTGQGFADSGRPVKQLGEPVYFEYLAAAIDKHASLDTASFRQRVNEILQEMHSDGTLLDLSDQYYGLDLTTAAGEFDVANLEQD